jgi:cation transport ATPase
MPIQVTCPKCLKRFQVSDKFAGKTGPCPSCKNQIKVPDKSEEVKIHTPDDGAPKDRTGQSVLKPIKRKETEVTRKGLFITIGAILGVVALAVGMRVSGGTPFWAIILGAVGIAPPLVWAGYKFVQDSELAPYVGQELRNRVLVCAALFASLWLLYWFLPSYLFDLDSPAEMTYLFFGIIISVMLVIGAFISVATFELEFSSGLAHAGLYFIATILLAVISGITLAGAGS